LSADELATQIKLPEKYAELPYLGEFYGTVAWSVRSIYNGYVGWFDGNPTNLNKSSPENYAEKILKLIGDENKVILEIKKSIESNDPQFAIELCDLLIASKNTNKIAKTLKAECLLALSKLETSANGRHYYIACAKELLSNI
jgi:alkyl sulfatase BDS1-like metallo-beta-lactamase superfamily hydrolase